MRIMRCDGCGTTITNSGKSVRIQIRVEMFGWSGDVCLTSEGAPSESCVARVLSKATDLARDSRFCRTLRLSQEDEPLPTMEEIGEWEKTHGRSEEPTKRVGRPDKA